MNSTLGNCKANEKLKASGWLGSADYWQKVKAELRKEKCGIYFARQRVELRRLGVLR